jgi:2-polyprenyl-3-methyl-5-hydroxy-6-metoxy-1,4-benzoquinol methylase
MQLLCPNCCDPIDAQSLGCRNGHQFACEDGVLVLLEETFKQQLQAFVETFTRLRADESRRLLDPSVYKELPFAPKLKWQYAWRVRRYDLAIINRLLQGRTRQQILDVGAWNGWLSHRLATQGHEVTAIDYFTDEYDGLRAKKFYDLSWKAIQMDVYDLSVLNQTYDVIILNRCLQFSDDPAGYVASVKTKVASDGLLILTGLGFYWDPLTKIRDVAAFRAHLNSYGLDFFKPTKAYLDFVDKERLQNQGVRLHPYPQLWARATNLKARFKKTWPLYYYGVYAPGSA